MRRPLLSTGMMIFQFSVFSQKDLVEVESDQWESGVSNEAIVAAAEANPLAERQAVEMVYFLTHSQETSLRRIFLITGPEIFYPGHYLQ